MSSFQNKLLSASHKLRRRLYDERVKRSGQENRIIRLTLQQDDFGDYTSVTVLDHGLVEAEIVGLEKIPLNRLRTSLDIPSTLPTTNLNFFDVLPLIVRTTWDAKVEKGDILIKKLQDDRDNTKALYLTIQITESIGTFDTQLISREYNASFYTERFNQEIMNLIETY